MNHEIDTRKRIHATQITLGPGFYNRDKFKRQTTKVIFWSVAQQQ